MLPPKKAFIFLIVAVWLFTPGTVFADRAAIITFKYPPYMKGDETGLIEQIFQAMAQTSGQPIDFKLYPRKRAIITFSQPEIQDMFLGEREYFSQMAESLRFLEIIRVNSVFVYLKEAFPDFSFHDLNDLTGKRVGLSRGSINIPLFTSKGIIVDIAPVESNLMKLKIKRIDFWHTLDFAARALIKKNGMNMDDFAMIQNQSLIGVLMVKKGSPAEQAFNALAQGLEEIRSNGTYDAIFQDFQ